MKDNSSGKVLTIFSIIIAILLTSLTAMAIFLLQKEREIRSNIEISQKRSEIKITQLNQQLDETEKQLLLLEEKNKDADEKINSLMDDLELEEGIRGQIKTENVSLKGRPNQLLTKTIRQMGVPIFGKGINESIPIKIGEGQLKGGKLAINADLSSQFISALLIACPLLNEDTQLQLKGKKLVSTDYIKMTMQILKQEVECSHELIAQV